MNLRKLVPMRDRQNIATSIVLSRRGTSAISQTSTNSLTLTRSYECTVTRLFVLKWRARAASPHPKSATVKRDFEDLERRSMNTSIGFVGHDCTWWRKPSWYFGQKEQREANVLRGRAKVVRWRERQLLKSLLYIISHWCGGIGNQKALLAFFVGGGLILRRVGEIVATSTNHLRPLFVVRV